VAIADFPADTLQAGILQNASISRSMAENGNIGGGEF
jgi:hypothetical protein